MGKLVLCHEIERRSQNQQYSLAMIADKRPAVQLTNHHDQYIVWKDMTLQSWALVAPNNLTASN